MGEETGRMDVVLRPATLQDGVEIWSMIQEIGPGENGFHNEGYETPLSRFDEFLRRLVDNSRGRGLRRGLVPQTTFWAFVDGRPVGICKIRHHLTDALRVSGGHIGYSIRPSERGKGYGTRMLAEALVRAREIGISWVLITVNEDNPASWRMVEANAGSLEKVSDGKRYYRLVTRGP
ncbi:MAG: GNAT family N-acetyltransferase [Spirochaetota bacterium]